MATWGTTELVPAGIIGGPLGMAYSPSGGLYVADYYNRVWKVTGHTASVFAGSGATGHADGTGTAATFNIPSTLTVDASGNVYVAEWDGFRKITPAGVVTTIPGIACNYFVHPSGLTVDASGNVYVVNWDANILKVTPAGAVSTLATVSGAELATISYDTDSGDLFVTNSVSRELLRVTTAGVVTSVATLAFDLAVEDLMYAAFDRFGVLNIVVRSYDSGGRILRYSPPAAAWLESATLDLGFNPADPTSPEQVYGIACSAVSDAISYLYGTQISTLVRSTSRLHTVGGHFRSAAGAQINMMQRDGIGPWLPIEDL